MFGSENNNWLQLQEQPQKRARLEEKNQIKAEKALSGFVNQTKLSQEHDNGRLWKLSRETGKYDRFRV